MSNKMIKDLTKKIESIMRQILAHVWWMYKGSETYNSIQKVITKNPEKRAEIVKLLYEKEPK